MKPRTLTERIRQRVEAQRQQCRDAGHAGVDWHWNDGRPRTTCGFCGDALDHAKCPRKCQAETKVTS